MAKKPKPSAIRAAVVLSDLHCGSTTALLPPNFKIGEGQRITLNAVQEWLWLRWGQFWQDVNDVLGNEPFALVLNGDLIEGNHHRTKEIVSPDPQDHFAAAVEILKPIVAKAAKVLVAEGTDCHTGGAEHALADYFDAVRCPSTDRAAWDIVDATIHGTRCIFQHHVSTTSREWLRVNGLGMAFANEQLAAVRQGERMPKVLGMAHRHLADLVVSEYGVAFATPSWQGGTRHVAKVAPQGKRRLECGGMVLDWRGLKEGEKPKATPITYRRDISGTGGVTL